MPTNAYDSEKTYLRALVPRRTRIGLKGRSFQPIVDEDKLHSISYTLYSADELEVGSFEERYQIISETMDELESMLGITIIKSGPYSYYSCYKGKLVDYVYKICWKSEEEQKKDLEKEELGLGEFYTSSIYPSEEEYAELYNLKQDSSIPEKADAKNEEKPKQVEEAKEEDKPKEVEEQKPLSTKFDLYKKYFNFDNLDFDNLKAIPEHKDTAFTDIG
jgi:hypothetical protein